MYIYNPLYITVNVIYNVIYITYVYQLCVMMFCSAVLCSVVLWAGWVEWSAPKGSYDPDASGPNGRLLLKAG